MTATTNALSTAATGSSQGYTVQSCSPQQTSGTPTSSMGDHMAMDMDTGDIHMISSWPDDDE